MIWKELFDDEVLLAVRENRGWYEISLSQKGGKTMRRDERE